MSPITSLVDLIHPLSVEAYHLLYERGLIIEKASIYARGNVPEFIIINLVDYKMESYKSPKEGIYTEIRILSRGEEFSSSAVQGLIFSLDSILSFCQSQ